MNQNNKFDINELDTFDIKEYFFKIVDHWKLILITVLLGLIIANVVNRRAQRIYNLKSTITVSDEQNPLFTSSTNIAFNWGGPSDKVENIISILQSRTHNEKVVKRLKYYIEYYKEGKYRKEDIYGKNPFIVILDSLGYQLQGTFIQLDFLTNNQVAISVEFEKETEYRLTNYNFEKYKNYFPEKENYKKTFSIEKHIESPFFSFIIEKENLVGDLSGKTYFVRFNNLNAVVNAYSSLEVSNKKKGTSLIELELYGSNKRKIEDYINTTVAVLDFDQRKQKIEYAIRTKKYIDTLFQAESSKLKNLETDLGSFKQSQDIYDLSAEGTSLLSEITQLDGELEVIKNKLNYYKNLESYIINRDQYDEIISPAMVNVEDPNLAATVNSLMTLSKEKKSLELTVNPSYPGLKKINDQINVEREVLLENLSSLKRITNNDLKNLNRQLAKSNIKLKKLSPKEQQLLNYQRKYDISQTNYDYLVQKSYEAGTAIAANVSDIKVLDRAKDIGQHPVRPKTRFNYLIGLMLGTVLPLLFIITKEAMDNNISSVEDVEKMYKIPVLGVLGKNNYSNRLVVFNRPNSTIAESFRAIRSNIQFLLKRDSKNKTIVVTSSVGKEGKTLAAINLASVFAMSGKKTVLIGFDLRKPKMHEDFDHDNSIGVVNYLIGEKEIEDIIVDSQIENLDFISSGPVPPNPAELILSKETDELFEYLKGNYEYIIVDTPPVGLVADSLELFKFSDAIIYIIRQDYTQKGMPKMIDDKYVNGEVKNISYILNDFKVQNRYGGGYGYGYGYGYGKYGSGYHTNEKESFISKIKKKFKN